MLLQVHAGARRAPGAAGAGDLGRAGRHRQRSCTGSSPTARSSRPTSRSARRDRAGPKSRRGPEGRRPHRRRRHRQAAPGAKIVEPQRRRERRRRRPPASAAPAEAGRLTAMKLSDLSIRRPVFATVMSLLLIVLGVIAFARLTAARAAGDRSADRLGRRQLPRRLGGGGRDAHHPDPRGRARRHRGHRDDRVAAAATAARTITIEFTLDARHRGAPPTTCATRSAASPTACPRRPTRRRSRRSRPTPR